MFTMLLKYIISLRVVLICGPSATICVPELVRDGQRIGARQVEKEREVVASRFCAHGHVRNIGERTGKTMLLGREERAL